MNGVYRARMETVARRWRCVAAVVFLLAAVAVPVTANGPGFVIIDSSVTPSSVSVGDRAELRVVIRSTEPETIRLPSEYPTGRWVEFRSMRMIERGEDREVRVVFSPFRVGTLTLPDIDLGAGTFSGARIRVDSVLPDDGSATIEPVEPPAFMAGFQVMAFVVFVVLIAAPFVLYRLAVALALRSRVLAARYRANRPYRRIVRSVRELRTLFDELDAKSFYIRLVDDLRAYLTDRVHGDFMVATVTELSHLLEERIESGEQRQRLQDLFQRADLIKFASRESDTDQRLRDIETVVELIAYIENRRSRSVIRRTSRPVRGLARREAA